MNMARTNISLPPEIRARIEKLQQTTGASMSEIIRRALLDYFAKTGH